MELNQLRVMGTTHVPATCVLKGDVNIFRFPLIHIGTDTKKLLIGSSLLALTNGPYQLGEYPIGIVEL